MISADTTKTMMAPSSSEGDVVGASNQAPHCSYSVMSMASAHEFDDFRLSTPSQQSIEELQPRKDEPNLYNIPSFAYPEYRPLSTILKVLLGSLSIVASSKLNVVKKTSILKVIVIATSTFILSSTFVQDMFYAPSRITTRTLSRNQWLPSPLSKYSIISTSVPSELHQEATTLLMDSIGVHFLEYENSDILTPVEYKFDAIHFNHGFGASSLSWLPVIPSLVKKIGGKIGIAHDAPGFGFTDRPSASGKKAGLVPFSSAGNAALGNSLLNERLKTIEESHVKKVALFGHSMGCASTLKMALTLPTDVEKTIVLVAPALVGNLRNGNRDVSPTAVNVDAPMAKATEVKESIKEITLSQPAKIRNFVRVSTAALRRVILDPILIYMLKRVVGQPKFWNKGLRAVWGDPEKLSDTDALRFQWPSIGQGWENGLLAFTRSRLFSICPYSGGELQLLKHVAKMKNTKVIIVQGTNDPVVPLRMSRKIAESLEEVQFVEIDGSGHDPFEEDVEDFVNKIEEVL